MNTYSHANGAATGVRRGIATFGDYTAAQRAVDVLSEHGFPIERLAIVGSGLRYVEDGSARETLGQAARAGAVRGAVLGVLFWLLFGIFFTVEDAFVGILVYSVLVGLIFGAIIAALDHAAGRGERDQPLFARLEAERYDVQVDVEVADRARRLLREMQTSRPASQVPPSAA